MFFEFALHFSYFDADARIFFTVYFYRKRRHRMDDMTVIAQRKIFSLPLAASHSRLSCSICTPRLEKFPIVSKFYDQVADRCQKYCETIAANSSLSGDICFRLSFKSVINEGVLTVSLSSSLYNKRTGHVFERGNSTQDWSLSRQKIIPIKKRVMKARVLNKK